MTNTQILQWIKKNLSPYILRSISLHPGTFVTEALMAGIVCRETGGLIAKHAAEFPDIMELAKHMKGDYTDRGDGKGLIPHGFGFTQIDINAFPWFISTNAWLDPYKCFSQSIAVLEGARAHILGRNPVLKGSTSLIHYSVAAYNCGAGNVDKALTQHIDPDRYTTAHNYSAEVFEFAEIYKTIV